MNFSNEKVQKKKEKNKLKGQKQQGISQNVEREMSNGNKL
jgi:hypothetical protein